jgi:hypothetical protein
VAPRAEAPSGPGGHSGLGLWRILKASGAPEDYARNLATESLKVSKGGLWIEGRWACHRTGDKGTQTCASHSHAPARMVERRAAATQVLAVAASIHALNRLRMRPAIALIAVSCRNVACQSGWDRKYSSQASAQL